MTRYLDADYLAGVAAATGAIPSYAQITEDAPPLETSALASAEERFNNAVVPLITADSAEAFEAAYDDFINNLVNLGDWRFDLQRQAPALGRVDGSQRLR